jgi:hypothetical protein
MDTIASYRQIIQEVLSRYSHITYAYGDIRNETVFDLKNDRYMVVSMGWDDVRRIHGCLLHVEILDGNIWIQRDGTEDGIALELEQAGIPKEHIVLGFHEPDVRQYTGYAVG